MENTRGGGGVTWLYLSRKLFTKTTKSGYVVVGPIVLVLVLVPLLPLLLLLLCGCGCGGCRNKVRLHDMW